MGEYLFNGINVEGLNSDQMALLRRNYLGLFFKVLIYLEEQVHLENVGITFDL